MIPLLVIGVGCVAIWPVTVPKLEHRHREVAMLALPKEISPNLGKNAHVDVVVVDQFGSVAGTSCTMRLAMSILLIMLASCTCHWALNRLWSRERLRWKILKKQKTKKDLCECGRCRCHIVFSSHWSAKRKEKFEGML